MSALIRGERMRRLRRRATSTLLALAAAAVGSLMLAPAASAAPPAASISATVTPAATEGQPVTVTVTATDVVDLYAYDLTFGFDPALLGFDAASVVGPDGGFTSSTPGAGTATITHTRLGTSPGLTTAAGASITLATFTFTALDAGTAQITLPTVRLVSSTTEVTPLTNVASASTVLAALPDTGGPGPGTPSASPSPSVTPSALPVADGVDGDLAGTGADATPWLIAGAVGIALVAVGALVVIRRRQAVNE